MNGAAKSLEIQQNLLNDEENYIKTQLEKLGLKGASKGEIKNKLTESQYRGYKTKIDIIEKIKEEIKILAEMVSITDARINEFKEGSPDLFKIMDNMENELGESVDVYVSVTKMERGNWGATEATFDQEGLDGEVRPKSKLFGVNTVHVQLAIKNQQAFNDPTSTPSTLTTFKHEMGHANYIITQTCSYFLYLQNLDTKKINHQNGHNPGNPSGARANEWQKK